MNLNVNSGKETQKGIGKTEEKTKVHDVNTNNFNKYSKNSYNSSNTISTLNTNESNNINNTNQTFTNTNITTNEPNSNLNQEPEKPQKLDEASLEYQFLEFTKNINPIYIRNNNYKGKVWDIILKGSSEQFGNFSSEYIYTLLNFIKNSDFDQMSRPLMIIDVFSDIYYDVGVVNDYVKNALYEKYPHLEEILKLQQENTGKFINCFENIQLHRKIGAMDSKSKFRPLFFSLKLQNISNQEINKDKISMMTKPINEVYSEVYGLKADVDTKINNVIQSSNVNKSNNAIYYNNKNKANNGNKNAVFKQNMIYNKNKSINNSSDISQLNTVTVTTLELSTTDKENEGISHNVNVIKKESEDVQTELNKKSVKYKKFRNDRKVNEDVGELNVFAKQFQDKRKLEGINKNSKNNKPNSKYNRSKPKKQSDLQSDNKDPIYYR